MLVLLIVLGLIAGSAAVLFTKSTKLGLDLQGGVRLVYQGKPTKQTKVTAESLQRALDIMRDRVDAFGVSEPGNDLVIHRLMHQDSGAGRANLAAVEEDGVGRALDGGFEIRHILKDHRG